MHLFMGHVVSSMHILKEIIFLFICILDFFFFFLSLVCVFLVFPTSKIFPKTCFVFPIFIGGESCFSLNLCCSLRELLFIRGVASIFYRAYLFCVPLNVSFFFFFLLLISLVSVFCLPSDFFVNT